MNSLLKKIVCFFTLFVLTVIPVSISALNEPIINYLGLDLSDNKWDDEPLDVVFPRYYCTNFVSITLNRRASLMLVPFEFDEYEFDVVRSTSHSTYIPFNCIYNSMLLASQMANSPSEMYDIMVRNVEISNVVDFRIFRKSYRLEIYPSTTENIQSVVSYFQGRENVFAISLLCIEFAGNSTASVQPINSIMTTPSWPVNNWIQDLLMVYEARNFWPHHTTINVGIIDTGISAQHPGIRDFIHPDQTLHKDLLAGTAHSGNPLTDPFAYSWPNGHGTPVAALITSVPQWNLSVADNVRLISIRAGSTSGGGYIPNFFDTVARGIQHAQEIGLRLLNISLAQLARTVYQPLYEAVKQFRGLIVASSGNHGISNDRYFPWNSPRERAFPASIRSDNLISVGAADMNDNRSDWLNGESSNWGRVNVCLFAPGGRGTMGYQTVLSLASQGGFTYFGGTSASAALITSVAALMMSAYPAIAPYRVRQIIINTVDRVGDDYVRNECVARGRANAYRAIQMIPLPDLIITPEMFAFESTYFTNPRTVRHFFPITGDFAEILSTRVRTGLNEEGLIVLSANREGQGLAFFEMHFPQNSPSFINFDLSLWSGIEFIMAGIVTIRLLGRNYNEPWVQLWSFSTSILPRRDNPLGFALFFDKPINTFRLEVTVSTPNGNQNRGRLCIHRLMISFA